jgi:catechol 2,3-dioxygenase-like lactoylglutathione lyase family enzyme
MDDLFARPVFYVKDAEGSLKYYTESLGFSLDWNHAPNGRAFVFQVSLLGVQLIINEAEDWTESRVGQGRAFVGIDDHQYETFRQHVEAHGIQTEVVPWGEPTLLIRDPDGNWLTFWLPDKERATLQMGQRWP